jgi:hypothetical protein
MYVIRNDLETQEVTDWESRIQDHSDWKIVTVVAKMFTELLS